MPGWPRLCDHRCVTTMPDETTRRLYRAADRRVLGGVARGLADHLGVDVLWIRLAFIVLVFAYGTGLVLYGAFWAVTPLEPEPATAAQRPPRRAAMWRRSMDGDRGLAVGFALIFVLGAFMLLEVVGIIYISYPLVLALALSAAGIAVLWQQADDAQRARWRAASDRPLVRRIRTLIGITLVGIGGAVFLASRGDLGAARDSLAATIVILAGAAVITWPMWMRLVRELSAERRERVRSQERAEIAAHLHDSVLHTLTLIQRHVDDPREVARLARAQERSLRNWLYHRSDDPGTFQAAIERTAAEVEEAHGAPIDVVVVGDRQVDDRLVAQLSAAREAMVNAAKYADGAPVSVYAEVEDGEVAVFVKDRGPGFDFDAVPPDRLGIRQSIIGRMQRHGGRAEVRSAPGEGTEVRLFMPMARGGAGQGESRTERNGG